MQLGVSGIALCRTNVNLKSCVSSWPQPSYSTLHCFSLYYYYPTTCGWDVDQRDWDIRNLIWNLKANPNRPQSSSEIALRHELAMDKVEKPRDFDPFGQTGLPPLATI